MYNQKAQFIIEQGDQFLENAQMELFKAEEDAVPYLICSNARQSIAKYLTAFLVNQGKTDQLPESLEGLVGLCRKEDPRFNHFELEILNCNDHTHDVAYCTNLQKVKVCVDVAKKAKELLKEEIWPLSKPVK